MATEAADHSAVRFAGVGLRYGAGPDVLHDVSFALEAGSLHFLTGPSGAGKTTLLRLIYLALKPTAGRITMFGHDIAATPRHLLPSLRRRIGVVFQDFRLLPHLSAFDNVALSLRIVGADEAVIRRDVTELLAWVGLGDHLDARPATLSGGQQQLVAIARAVIARPRFIFADEPTGSVDDRMALRLMYLFEQLNALGTTIVVATHNQSLINRFPHPRLMLDNGRLTPAPAPAVRPRHPVPAPDEPEPGRRDAPS
ncbi:MAG: ATP-binding cassette domain-containing protein [Rhodospirillales bacterium]|nr:ATP-binding cassette domain-containing protein [Rhodospirillales bacterium]